MPVPAAGSNSIAEHRKCFGVYGYHGTGTDGGAVSIRV